MRRTLVFVLLLLALPGGCRKKQAPAGPPVTLPPPIQPRQTPVVEAPSVQPVEPAVPRQAPPEEIVPLKPEEIAPPPAPKKPPVRRTRTPRRNQPAPPPAAPAPVPAEKVETPPSKPPQLGELLDEGQRERYRQQYDASLGSARASLAAAEGRDLNRSQADTAARVRGFIQEAEKIRSSDIRTAAQLALRASSLGRDLQNSLR